MTQQEAYAVLREKVARAMRTRLSVNVLRHAPHVGHGWLNELSVAMADAALVVVKAALAEPDEAMLNAGQIPGWSRWEVHGRWRAMLAASPLAEAPDAE